jgi:hypothetical protein
MIRLVSNTAVSMTDNRLNMTLINVKNLIMGGLSAKKPTKTTWVNKFPFTTLLSH